MDTKAAIEHMQMKLKHAKLKLECMKEKQRKTAIDRFQIEAGEEDVQALSEVIDAAWRYTEACK